MNIINKISKRNFSYIHNFHSPSKYFLLGKEYIYDNTIDDYNNLFIRAFMNKRWTTKKEISK